MSQESITAEEIKLGFMAIQDHICDFLASKSGQGYQEDRWDYTKGSGGGITRVWSGKEHADVIEKGGVAFSFIQGDALPPSAATKFSIPEGTTFLATGVSLVIHPVNPHFPTIHFNIRYFEAGDKWWFGGGVDLTPNYPRFEDVVAFHKKLHELCEKHGEDYAVHKKACDEYFYIPHRKETRGVGGLFFDHLTGNKRERFLFISALGYLFTELYQPFFAYKSFPYSREERAFQLYRRGRYVEFNLIYDRGTKFGLQSDGRTESIFLSMPALAVWQYNWSPEPDTLEHRVMTWYLQPQDWINMKEAPVEDKALRPTYNVLRKLSPFVHSLNIFVAGVAVGLVVSSVFGIRVHKPQ